MKKFSIQIAKFIVDHNNVISVGGAVYACFRIGSEMLRGEIDPLSLLFVIVLLKIFYPLIRLVSGMIAGALRAAANLYLRSCGESAAGGDYGYRTDEESYQGYSSYSNEERGESFNRKTEYEKTGSNTENGKTGGNAGQTASDYDEALKYFGLQFPFTEEQLKTKRRKLMKTAHPDAGGSAEDAKKINEYYDVLKRYAA